ncbi:MAG: hypothetical protein OEY95_05985 [Candidatus Bathyarchaeota archaeon]|nr:hypothetical protein [Candidatus Bathyarchaeota archaeon]
MKRGNSKEKRILDKKLLVLSMGLVTIIIFGFLVYKTFFQTPEIKFSLKAAIIDQLGKHFPKLEFNETVTNLLEDAGFNVSYYGSEKINVNFYKELAKHDYGIIILRAHSALRADETIVDLFTSEEYDPDKYPWERENGLLTKGNYTSELELEGKFYFAITPKFIENLDGYFPKSIVIAMGCNSLNETCTEMAEAFIKKGARAYVGWTEIVLPEDTDYETVRLLEMLLIENKTLADATDGIYREYKEYGTGKIIISRMKFYPPSVDDLKISELIAEAKASSTTATVTFNDLGDIMSFLITNTSASLKRKPSA